jgi:hypothetical protein
VYSIHGFMYRRLRGSGFSCGATLVGDRANGSAAERGTHKASLFQGAEDAYEARPVPFFQPSRIVLAKGANTTAGRRRLAECICGAYAEAERVEAFDTPHHRVHLGEADSLRLHCQEKRRQSLPNTRVRSVAVRSRAAVVPTTGTFRPMYSAPIAATTAVWRAHRASVARRR